MVLLTLVYFSALAYAGFAAGQSLLG
jgi:hypothetical protein